MSEQPYRSEALLAELRAATSSKAAEECDICQLQNNIVCVHLTEDQYASLKARKRSIADDRRKGIELRVFDCGHVYRSLSRAWLDIDRPRTKTKGLCSECWRYITTNGRRVRLDSVGEVRRRPRPKRKSKSKTLHKSGVGPRPSRPIGEYQHWRVRGPMVGKWQV